MKYKVSFSGFAYVEADSEDEAIQLYHEDETVYAEQQVDLVETVDAFDVEF